MYLILGLQSPIRWFSTFMVATWYTSLIPSYCQYIRETNAMKITGDRTACPPWLLNASLKRGWTFVSADYRVLPESTGVDTIEDLCSAYAWIANELNVEFPNLADTSRIIVAGSSGGGYCATVGGVQFQEPKPKAVLAIYPMSDPASGRWAISGKPLPDMPVGDAAPTLAEIEKRRSDQEISFGEPLPRDRVMSKHVRFPYLQYIVQEGLYLDYLSGVKGLGKKIAEEGVEKAVPKELHQIFPVDFGITQGYPSTIVVHGTADRAVDVGEGEKLVKRLESVGGVKVKYYAVEGEDHAFDRTLFECEDETEDREESTVILGNCMKTLDSYVAQHRSSI